MHPGNYPVFDIPWDNPATRDPADRRRQALAGRLESKENAGGLRPMMTQEGSNLAELHIPTTDLTAYVALDEVKRRFAAVPGARFHTAYYNLYGKLVVSGSRLVLRDDFGWFQAPVATMAHSWVTHGRVVSTDGEAVVTD